MDKLSMKSFESNESPLVIYDSDEADKVIQIDEEGAKWSSRKEGVIFFESGNYRLYTSAQVLRGLLDLLITSAEVSHVAIRVSYFLGDAPPPFLRNASLHQEILRGVITVEMVDELAHLFQLKGSWEVWTFCGLSDAFNDTPPNLEFPEILKLSKRFPFVLEIDLDALMQGYVKPSIAHRSELLKTLRKITVPICQQPRTTRGQV